MLLLPPIVDPHRDNPEADWPQVPLARLVHIDPVFRVVPAIKLQLGHAVFDAEPCADLVAVVPNCRNGLSNLRPI